MAHSIHQPSLITQLRTGLGVISMQFGHGKSEIAIGLIKEKLPIAAVADEVLIPLTQASTWKQVDTLNKAITTLIASIAEPHIDQTKVMEDIQLSTPAWALSVDVNTATHHSDSDVLPPLPGPPPSPRPPPRPIPPAGPPPSTTPVATVIKPPGAPLSEHTP